MSRPNWALLISGCTFIGGCSPQPQPVAETATVAEMKPAEMAPAAESAAPAADGAAQADNASAKAQATRRPWFTTWFMAARMARGS